MEFIYNTKSETKKVVIGSTYDGGTFVDVYPEYGMHTSNAKYFVDHAALLLGSQVP